MLATPSLARSSLALALLFVGCGPSSTAMPAPDGGAPDAAPDAAVLTIDAAVPPEDAGPLDCVEPGLYREQTLTVGAEERFYLLFVPERVACETAAPLWIDLHGTAGDRPEEAYGLEAQLAIAEREGVVLVRPRSRFSSVGGGPLYRWDQNAGDLDRNGDFVAALVEALRRRQAIDPERVYLSGFSSGTNMSSQILARGDLRITGLGVVAGGVWSDATFPPLSSSRLRVYATSGYRDYLHYALDRLLDELASAGLPADRVLVRETDSGHDLYGWQYEEMWAWLDEGVRAEPGTLAPGWSFEREPVDGAPSLLAIAASASGELLAVGARSTAWRRGLDGTWRESERPASSASLVDVCVSASGVALATGDGQLFRSTDGGARWEADGRVRDPGGAMLGYAHLNALSCAPEGSVLGAGYWVGLRSDDDLRTYSAMPITRTFGDVEYAGQIAALGRSSEGTVLAVGYYALVSRRGDEDARFEAIDLDVEGEWVLDVDAGPARSWWIVGDGGALARSTDDGRSFVPQDSGTEADLYAIDMDESGEGFAAGRDGTVLWTTDGGARWEPIPTGLSGFVGDIRRVAPGRAIAVGEAGAILAFDAAGR